MLLVGLPADELDLDSRERRLVGKKNGMCQTRTTPYVRFYVDVCLCVLAPGVIDRRRVMNQNSR